MVTIDRQFKRSTVVVWLLFTILLGLPIWLLIPYTILFDILRAIAVSVGCGVIYVYGRGIANGFKNNNLSYGHLLIFGIIFSWIAIVVALLWNWISAVVGIAADGNLSSLIVTFFTWLFIFGGVLHLTAHEAIEGYIPQYHWLRIGLYITSGVLLGLLVLRFVLI